MPFDEKYEDSTLLTLLAQDSEYAFQLVFDRYRNTIYKVAMLYVKSPVIAEEIVQDVFLKLWFQRKNITEIRSLQSWLFIIARNLTINSMKKIAHEWTARGKWVKENEQTENTADFRVLNAEYEQLLHKAVETLSPQQQQVYRLAKEEGYTYEMIGQQLSISPLTVKTHMARALTSIRQFLQKHGVVPVILILTGLASH